MRLPRLLACTLITFAVLQTVIPLRTAEAQHCGVFRYYSQYVDVQLIDLGEPGLSVGDIRVGHVLGLDENGEQLSIHNFEAIVSPTSEENYYRFVGTGHDVYENGMISWSGTYRAPDPEVQAPVTDDADNQVIVVSVVGGTGDFAGANGTLSWFVDEDGRNVGEYNINCPD